MSSPIGERFIPAFNARDAQTMQELVADDVEIHPLRAVLEDVVYRGRDGITQWLADLDESWTELRIELVEIDDTVPGIEFVTGVISGRGSESTAPTEAAAWWLVETRDGLVERLRTFTDRTAANEAFTTAAAQPDSLRASFAEFQSMDTSDRAAWRELAGRLWTEDVEMIEDPRWPGAGEFRGRDAVAGRFHEYFQTFSQATAEVKRVHGAGEVLVLELLFAASGSGSGARVEQRWAWLVRVRDGQLASIRPYLDITEALEAAGLAPS